MSIHISRYLLASNSKNTIQVKPPKNIPKPTIYEITDGSSGAFIISPPLIVKGPPVISPNGAKNFDSLHTECDPFLGE